MTIPTYSLPPSASVDAVMRFIAGIRGEGRFCD
jgi:hypothetical protein